MLYKIRPRGPMQWSPLLTNFVLKVLREQDKPLSSLDWEDAETSPTPEALKLALRYGSQAEDGLYVPMYLLTYLEDVPKGEEARSTLRALQRDEIEYHRHLEKVLGVDQQIPEREEYARQMDELSSQTVEETKARVQRLLDAPERPELVEHWKNLH